MAEKRRFDKDAKKHDHFTIGFFLYPKLLA